MPTSVKDNLPKDVFVIHSKSDAWHGAIVDRLTAAMKALGRPVWGYSDWPWEAERQGSRVRYHWAGRVDQLDPARLQAKLPAFRKRDTFTEVDRKAIDELLEKSSVVVLLAPTSGELSDGSAIEIEQLAALFGREPSSERADKRPLIIEAGWRGESWPDFAALNPALRLTLTADTQHEEVRLTAMCVAACVVHTLQTDYRIPGHHLLSRAASENKIVDRLVSGSVHHRKLDFIALEKRSRQRARELAERPERPVVRWGETRPGMVRSPNEDDVRSFLRHMDLALSPVIGSQKFSKFLDTDIIPFRAWIDAQTDDSDELVAVRSLLQRIVSSWPDSFDRFEWAETLLDEPLK